MYILSSFTRAIKKVGRDNLRSKPSKTKETTFHDQLNTFINETTFFFIITFNKKSSGSTNVQGYNGYGSGNNLLKGIFSDFNNIFL